MNVLCSSYEYPPIGGGGARVAQPLAAALSARGHVVDVVTSGMPGLPGSETIDGVTVHRVACKRAHRHYTTTAELLTYLRPAYAKAAELNARHGYAVNHTHFALPTGLVSWWLYRKTGLPYVLTLHGSDVPGYNPDRFRLAHRIVQPLWRRIIGASASIVSPSLYLKNLLQSQVDVPVRVIPNGFDTEAPSGTTEKRNRILVVTRMFPRKGVQHLLDALAGMRHDWEVVVAGDGPYLESLRRQAARLGVTVDFRGFVQGAALAELYTTSKIFVFPSTRENFPTVLLEAMQAGCAVVTTDVEGCREVIGDAGVTVAPGQPTALREALTGLMRDPALIVRYGARARTRIGEFSWPEIAARYELALQEALLPRDASA